MGTRGLTMVVTDKETKIAQYGQWDHYPEGQGVTALEFLKSKSLNKFRKQLDKVRFQTKEDEKELEKFFKSIGCKNGWMDRDQAKKYHETFPLLTRNNGAQILNLIQNLKEPTFLIDSSGFAGDSLFCEWAYVIDFDKNTFEVYEGFNKEPLKKNERFYSYFQHEERRGDDQYYPVKLVKSYNLDELPGKSQFVKEIVELTKEEE